MKVKERSMVECIFSTERKSRMRQEKKKWCSTHMWVSETHEKVLKSPWEYTVLMVTIL